jgi:hypothetical protein
MNYKLSLSLLLPFLIAACAKEPVTSSTASMQSPILQQHSKVTYPAIIFLEVAPDILPCEGVAPQTCLLVRELTFNQAGQKTYLDKESNYFYDSIDGFTHNPNSPQIIKVKRTEISQPAADQSSYQYTFDSIIETTAKP